jgi:hypothetical protein
MPTFLFPLFRWTDTSWLSVEIRASTWQFAVLEMVHLAGLAILLGTLVIIDMRLFGFGLSGMRVSKLARELSRWTLLGLAIAAGSGVFLFFGEPMKLFGSPSFFVKMVLFLLAVLVQFTLFRKVKSDQAAESGANVAIGTLALVLWLGVGLAGRAIGFL